MDVFCSDDDRRRYQEELREADWPWASARAHVREEADPLLPPTAPFPGAAADWAGWLVDGLRDDEVEEVRRHMRTGRPRGLPGFLDRLEDLLNRVLRPQKAGREPTRETIGGGCSRISERGDGMRWLFTSFTFNPQIPREFDSMRLLFRASLLLGFACLMAIGCTADYQVRGRKVAMTHDDFRRVSRAIQKNPSLLRPLTDDTKWYPLSVIPGMEKFRDPFLNLKSYLIASNGRAILLVGSGPDERLSLDVHRGVKKEAWTGILSSGWPDGPVNCDEGFSDESWVQYDPTNGSQSNGDMIYFYTIKNDGS